MLSRAPTVISDSVFMYELLRCVYRLPVTRGIRFLPFPKNETCS